MVSPIPSQSYYEVSAGPPAIRRPLTGRADAAVCVIGGGFAGLNAALGLIERGQRDVVVLEAERVGFGASGRNGGFVFGGFSLDVADLVKQIGATSARRLYELTCDAVALIRRRVDTHHIDCDRVDGGAVLADWFGDDTALRRIQRNMRDHVGVDWEWMSRDAVRQQLRTERYHAGLFERDAFHFHPLKYARGLARLIDAGGGTIHEASPAIAVTPDGAGWCVTTQHGSVHAAQVLVAAGGYLQGLVPSLHRAILPIATYVMVTEPLGERLAQAVDSPAAIYDTRFAFDYYRGLADTRLLWGGRISILQRDPQAIANLLRQDLARVYPALAGVRIDHAWGGLMSYSRHKMPQLGQLQPGLWHAQAFGGHGVAPTTLAGEVLAEAMSGGVPVPPPWRRFGLDRTLRPLGLVAAQATYTVLQWRDRWRDRLHDR